MGLLIDNTTSTISSSASSVSLSHTCSGSDRLLVVSVMMVPTGAGAGIHDIQFNGVSLTSQLALSNQVGSFVSSMGIMIAPPTGAHNVVITLGSSVPIPVIVSATSYTGADQINGIGAITLINDVSGTNSSITTNITTTKDNSMILDALLYYTSGTTGVPLNSGIQTVQTSQTNSTLSPYYTGASSNRTSPISSSYGMTWQKSSGDTTVDYVHTCVEILPANPTTGNVGLAPYTSTSFSGTSDSFSIPHSIQGSNPILILAIQGASGVLSNSTGVSFNSVDMTQVIRIAFGSSGTGFVYLYVLENPPTGLHTINVTMATSGDFSASVISFTGAATTNPIGVTNSQSNNSFFGSSVSISDTTTGINSYLIDSMMAGVSSPTSGGTQIPINNNGISEFPLEFSGASSYLSTSTMGTYNMIWNGSFGGGYAHVVVEILGQVSISNGPAGNGVFSYPAKSIDTFSYPGKSTDTFKSPIKSVDTFSYPGKSGDTFKSPTKSPSTFNYPIKD